MLIVFSGIIAGSIHVVSGPDHLAVVAPLVAENPTRGLKLGFRWGLGHGVGVLILGLLGLLIKENIDIDALSGTAEFLVGWLLVGVGCWSLWKTRASSVQPIVAHTHEGPGVVFGVGLFHGMAGTGHLLGVLPSMLLSQTEALLYLLMYFLSAIASMMGFGWILSKAISHLGSTRMWVFLTAIASIGIGIYWIVTQG